MQEYEGDDRREHKYSNIQHAFIFKPEVLLSGIASVIVAVVMLTMHVDGIDHKAQKAIDKADHYRDLQIEENGHIKEGIEEIKDQQQEQYRDLKHDINRLIDKQLSLSYYEN